LQYVPAPLAASGLAFVFIFMGIEMYPAVKQGVGEKCF
jgi:hypothetical protein